MLWVGSRDVLEGTITPGRLGQFVLYAVFAAAALGQLSEVWGDLSAASGAAERLFELLRVSPRYCGAGRAARAAVSRRAAMSGSTMSVLPIRPGRMCSPSTACRCR